MPHTSCKYKVTAEWSGTQPTEGKLKEGTIACAHGLEASLSAKWKESELTLETVAGTFAGHKLGPKTLDKTITVGGGEPATKLEEFMELSFSDILESAEESLLESPLEIHGSFGGCEYDLEASWTEHDLTNGTLTGKLGCGQGVSIEVVVSWDGAEATIEKAELAIAGLPVEPFDEGVDFDLPEPGQLDIGGMVESLLIEVGASAAKRVTGALFETAPENVIETLLQSEPEGLPSAVLGTLSKRCEKGTKEDPLCRTLKQEEARPGSWFGDDGSKGGSCPPLEEEESVPTNAVYICAPTLLTGTFDAGEKSIVVVPPLGAILALGPASGPFAPELKTKKSVLVAGGAISGLGLKIEAGENVEIGGSFVSMGQPVQIRAGKEVKIGEVDTEELLSPLPDIPEIGPPVAKVTAPALVYAGDITIAAGKTTVGSGSRISSEGMGGPGGGEEGEDPVAPSTADEPGGSSYGFGGAHAGYGGWPDGYWHGQFNWEALSPGVEGIFGEAKSPPGRGRTFDDPFNPKDPGSGGGGTSDVARGHPGGGVIQIEATSLNVDGKIGSDGNGCYPPEGDSGGGGGGGGTVNIATGTFSGNGEIEADGGGIAKGCSGGGNGGEGGGGMVAERYTSNAFTGSVKAFGGHDEEPGELTEDFVPDGGAGTVYELKTKEGPEAPKVGSGGGGEEEELELEDLSRTAPEAPPASGAAPASASGVPAAAGLPSAALGPAAAGAAPGDATAVGRGGADAHRPERGAVAESERLSPPASAQLRRRIRARLAAAHPPPRLTALRLSPSTFAPDPSGASIAAATPGASTGTTITYEDSAAAAVTFTVAKPATGLRLRGSCVALARVPAKDRRHLRRCAASVSVGSFKHADRRGANRLHFTGRLAGRTLTPGAYTLEASPRLAGHAGATMTTRFTIITPPSPPTPPAPEPPAKKEEKSSSPSTPSTPSQPVGNGFTSACAKASASPAGESTLIIDDGNAAYLPAADGTPLCSAWNNPHLTVRVEGGARVYVDNGSGSGTQLADYAKIAVLSDARLSVTPPAAGELPAPALKVEAGEVEVGAGARIEVNALGYAGAANGQEYGATASKATPSSWAAGGSHGGEGGVEPDAHRAGEEGHTEGESDAGSTYDSPTDPTLPGGGGGGNDGGGGRGSSGGGILYVSATKLVLDGFLQANGENNYGGTVEEQVPRLGRAATGAGGSIQVHATTLEGSGSIQADGGVPCVGLSEVLDIEYEYCTTPYSDESSGGGGLVLVVAPSLGGFSGTITAAGGAHPYGGDEGKNGVVTTEG